jgi:probable phosphoglycerate mutase
LDETERKEMTFLQNTLLQIYFIRHGETKWSISGQHTGRTDIPLTAHGEEMARQLGPSLRQITFARILTSASLRARQTCELAGLGPASEVEPDLEEWDYGDYEGRLSVDIRKSRPDWEVWRDGCPRGETPKEVSNRADRLIEHLIGVKGNIALFSHGQFGRVLAARWIGLPVINGRHLAIYPASLSILGHENDYPERRVISLWNAASVSPARGR